MFCKGKELWFQIAFTPKLQVTPILLNYYNFFIIKFPLEFLVGRKISVKIRRLKESKIVIHNLKTEKSRKLRID